MRTILLMVLVTGMTAACATSGDGERTRYDPYTITRAEIEDRPQFENAAQIVQGLRPRWLAPVAGTSIRAGQGVIRTYVDSRPGQGLGAIPRMAIEEIRFYPPAEAQARWGLNHQRGAIDVITRKNE